MYFARTGREHSSVLVLLGLFTYCLATANAQTDETRTPDVAREQREWPASNQAGSSNIRPLDAILRGILEDQKTIWASPAHLRKRDLTWLVPLAGATGFLLATDERNMRERFHSNATTRDRSQM